MLYNMSKLIASLALMLVVSLLVCDQQGASALLAGPQETDTSSQAPVTTTRAPPSTTIGPESPPSTTTTATTTTSAPKTTTTSKPASKNTNCPPNCLCTTTKLDCSGKGLTEIPKLKGLANFVEFNFANNSLSSVDLKLFPMARSLDLSNNRIVSFADPQKKAELTNLTTLNLAHNTLSSLSTLSLYKMPALESLNLTDNGFVLLNATDLNQMPSLKSLNISRNKIHLIHEIFGRNLTQLEKLDLSYNQLVDVPAAVRSATKIKWLRLDGNLMTSLRPSDLIGKPELEKLMVSRCESLTRIDPFTLGGSRKLRELIITDNKRLSDISGELFEDPSNQSAERLELTSFSLRNNNLKVLSSKFQDLKIDLSGNPWDCSCDMLWLINATQLVDSQPIHCASPVRYKDLEVNSALSTLNCKPEESMMQRFVLVVFLLFLVVLTIAVFVQRADICRRLQWRDQYGTIYYTKARFPMEQV